MESLEERARREIADAQQIAAAAGEALVGPSAQSRKRSARTGHTKITTRTPSVKAGYKQRKKKAHR